MFEPSVPLFVQVFALNLLNFPYLVLLFGEKQLAAQTLCHNLMEGVQKIIKNTNIFNFPSKFHTLKNDFVSHAIKSTTWQKIFFFSDMSRFSWREISRKNMHCIITHGYLEQNQKYIYFLKDKKTRSFSPAYRSTHECLQAPLTCYYVVQRFCRVQYIPVLSQRLHNLVLSGPFQQNLDPTDKLRQREKKRGRDLIRVCF